MANQTLTDDLAYIRDLAEAGANAPLLAGRFLIWWGSLGTLAYIGHYMIAESMFGLPPTALVWMWSVFIVLGIGGQKAMKLTFPSGKPGAGSAGNRVTGLVWMGGGMVLFSFFAGAFLAAVIQGTFDAFLWSVPVVLGVYGLCQLTSGLMARNRPLMMAGWIGIATVGVAVLLVGTNEIWLLGAAVAFLTVLVPGILLMRSEPSDVV